MRSFKYLVLLSLLLGAQPLYAIASNLNHSIKETGKQRMARSPILYRADCEIGLKKLKAEAMEKKLSNEEFFKALDSMRSRMESSQRLSPHQRAE